MNILKVDSKKCDSCGNCIEECSKKAIKIVGINIAGYWLHKHAKISKDVCVNCGTCVKACQQNAIIYTDAPL